MKWYILCKLSDEVPCDVIIVIIVTFEDYESESFIDFPRFEFINKFVKIVNYVKMI